MGLSWDLSRIPGYASDPEGFGKKYRENGVTEAVIWYAMFTGVGPTIDEDLIEEFVARIRVMEKWGQGITAEPLTDEEIRAHTGLHCNVALEPRGKWLARQFANAFPEAAEKDPHCPECGSRRLVTRFVSLTRGEMERRLVCDDCETIVETEHYYGEPVYA